MFLQYHAEISLLFTMPKSVIEFSFIWHFVACKDLASHALEVSSRKILNVHDGVMDEGDGQQKQQTGNTVSTSKQNIICALQYVCVCITWSNMLYLVSLFLSVCSHNCTSTSCLYH